MESIVSVLNFDEGGIYREINSPRSLEACLRAGLDPQDLLPKPKKFFRSPKLTDDMVADKYDAFERRRKEKIDEARAEREAIIAYGERMQKIAQLSASSVLSSPSNTLHHEKTSSTALEMEEARLAAVRRRQEKELEKMVAREQALVDLQLKIKRAEDEEQKKKREHDKKVAEMKAQAEKKRAKRAQELAEKEREELKRQKQLARKEAAFERKRKEAELELQKKLVEEAKQRDIERQEKLEEHRKQTEAIMDEQAQIAEQNRHKISEREAVVRAQIEAKKEMKREELLTKREVASKRIKEALDKHHQLHDEKKQKFMQSQQEATRRAKELSALERDKIKKQAEERERRNRQRLNRLTEASRTRQEYRESVMARLSSKDEIFVKLREERESQLLRKTFENDLRITELKDNVERMSRMKEFQRLQTLRKIQSEDERTERLLLEKLELQRRHREEAKLNLQRKHAIGNAMDLMRVTNDFSMLDQLFSGKKGRHGRKRSDDNDGDDNNNNRLAQTV